MAKTYKLFTTRMCPKCPAVKEFMQTVELKGKFIDASTPEGLEEARKYSLSVVPTVLFFDEQENLVATCHTIDEIKSCL